MEYLDTIAFDVEPTLTFMDGFNTTEMQDAIQHAQVIPRQHLLKSHLLRIKFTNKIIIGGRTLVFASNSIKC